MVRSRFEALLHGAKLDEPASPVREEPVAISPEAQAIVDRHLESRRLEKLKEAKGQHG